jgi:Holliday junction resolvasome RuvABC endonuclease subunit
MVIVGIDCGKNHVDAVALADDRVVSCMTSDVVNSSRPLHRDQAIKRMRFDLVSYLREMRDPPVIYVEDAIVMLSRAVAISIAQTVGMVLTLPYDVHLVPVDTWKKELCRSGASKTRVKEVVSGRYPGTADMFGDRQDLFDATGVAVFGQANQKLFEDFGSAATADPTGGELA